MIGAFLIGEPLIGESAPRSAAAALPALPDGEVLSDIDLVNDVEAVSGGYRLSDLVLVAGETGESLSSLATVSAAAGYKLSALGVTAGGSGSRLSSAVTAGGAGTKLSELLS